ncbi:tetratricopeptide repeat protein [Pseudothauera nasutitermitis]|uniref:Tetratricopeptide repeat protein n=1 Tax=Pseudothauera nasutitermitis TaxID=2565930 RepID=A0A4S4B602_9RHOO|nr:tetratricopeptide repeat protein [Pseudothauera nasutitermitis]THF67246.1 tetratricopeptide repeat protein [Pseudothauera nasutitermitis]
MRPNPLHLLLVPALSLLTGCGALTLKADPALSARTLAAPAAAMPAGTGETQDNTAKGLRLARLLRDQGRPQAAAEVYAQLEARNALKALELLEYASVAAPVQGAQDSLALFGRARRALSKEGGTLAPAAHAALCGGLGRARLALGQTDAALGDFDCVLAADPDNVAALNAKGVLLDARGRHAEARALFAHAIEQDPADLRVLNNLALSHLAAGETAEAVRLLAQTEAPQMPALRLNLALAYAIEGQRDDARRTLESFMPAALAKRALEAFEARSQRIAQGAPVGSELLAASRQALALQEADAP